MLIPTGNGRAREALNLTADPLGLIEPLIGVHSALNAERKIEQLREQMQKAGVKHLPPGYQMSLDAQGNSYRDYGRTLEDLTSRYLEHAEESRMKATWGERWRDLRIGKSGMTPVQFEERVMKIQQAAADANEAYEQGLKDMAAGFVKRNPNMHENVALGSYVDKQVRLELRAFAQKEGLHESGQSKIFAVNRYLREPEVAGRGQPDVRSGYNLYIDTTLALKHGETEQIMNWHRIKPGHFLMIIPNQIGGSYVIPPSSVKTSTPINHLQRKI